MDARPDWAEGSTQLVSRACLDACGPWDESFFLYSEETDFHLRAGARGFGVQYVAAAQAVHLEGDSGTSPRLWALLPMLGLISALAFAAMMASSRLLPMGLFGILSYVEPMLLFLLAVLFLGEAFQPQQLWTYGPIWLAILLTGWDSARLLRKQARRERRGGGV